MKRRFIWGVNWLVVLLLMVVASCVPAATPTSTPTPNPAPDITPDMPPASTPAATLPSNSTQRQHISGILANINGDMLTLTTTQGPVPVMISSENTTIQKITVGTVSDLHAGEYLIAVGPQDVNGNITATSIIIRPQSQGALQAPPQGIGHSNHLYSRTGAQRGVTGNLTDINGNILTLTTSRGTVTVTVGSLATIQKGAIGIASDFQEGQNLIVLGSQDADSIVNATSIIILPQSRSVPPPPPGRSNGFWQNQPNPPGGNP